MVNTRVDSPSFSPLNLDEEYNNALRSKSYIDIYAKLHHHQQEQEQVITNRDDLQIHQSLDELDLKSTHRSLSQFRRLLLDFFDTTRQSFTALSSLLSSLVLASSHHRRIRRLLSSLSRSASSASSSSSYSQLSSQLDRDNPLSPQNLAAFHAAHARYPGLIQRLNSANKKIDRRLRIRRLVFVFRECRKRLERVKRRVDGAAKGAYIVGRDMDTVSQMVRRVEDEVEHGREVGRMVVRNKGGDEEQWEIVREVVKEIEGRGRNEGLGLGLEEQVEELEEHIYLCLISINRSRRLVAEGIEEHED